MLTKIKSHISNFFNKGHERSVLAKKNIAASFLIKGINILVGLVIVPLTINYVDTTRYGVWMTLSSLIAWFGFFDIGLGQGLRNKFAEALAKGEHLKARVYVSTSYAILSIIVVAVIGLFIIANNFINWNVILNADSTIVSAHELSLLALIVFVFFCVSFVLKLITTILTADQRPALASFFDMLGKLTALVIIFVLTKTTEGSLLYLGTVYSVMPVVVLIGSSLWFFTKKYKQYKPSLKYVEFNQAKNLLSLGIKFFIIQIAGVIFYQTNAIIIAQMYGPGEVTVFTLTYQYFNIIASVFMIMLTPYWSAFTDAYTKKDFSWIRNQVQKLKKISFVIIALILVALIVIRFGFRLWVGEKVFVNMGLAISMAVFVSITVFNSINCQFLNGVGKIKIQLYVAIVFVFLHIPLALYFCSLFGLAGIMISSIINSCTTLIVYEVQYRKIINNTSVGIWNK